MPAGMRCAASTIPRRPPRHFARIAERRRRPDVAVARLLLARPRRRSRRARQCRPPIITRPRCSAPPSTASSRRRRSASSGISIDYPEPSARRPAEFAKREAVSAIGRLEDAGYPARAEMLYRDLAEQMTSPGELALLAVMAEKRGNHFLALKVGKIAGSARHRYRRAVASARRDSRLRQYFRRRQGAGLCDRPPGKRIQCRRRLRRRRPRAAAADAGHRQGSGQEAPACPSRRSG